MKDLMGKKIEIGQQCVVALGGTNKLVQAEVVDIKKKTVEVVCDSDELTNWQQSNIMLRKPKAVVVVEQ